MQLRSLWELLTFGGAAARAREARQQMHDELFPRLTLTRLEERRLLNAAPVAVVAPPPAKDDAVAAHQTAKSAAGNGSGTDIENLAITMYGGPFKGTLTEAMQPPASHATSAPNAESSSLASNTLSGVTTASAAVANGVSNNVAALVIGDPSLPVDQPPANTVPGPQTTNEDTPLVIGGLSVADPDSGSSPINTLFQVNQGVLSINTSMPGTIVLPGGTVELGNGAVVLGNGTNALQVVGTTSQINAALAPGLTYTPSLNFNGADTLTMVTNDLGATGTGGPLKDTDTVGITVAAVNDAPVNTVPGPQTTNEDTPLVIGGLSVADPDSGSSPINTLFEVNQGVLNINTSMPGTIVLPGGTVELGNGAVVLGNGTNALQVVGTTAQINAALAPGLTYTPSLNFNGVDTLTMVTNDLGATGTGGPLKDTDTVGITVAAVNDAPVNTVPGPQTTNEDTPLVITGLSVSDVDSGSSPINTLFEVNQGVLTINTSMAGTIVLPGGTVQLGNGAVVLGNGTNALQVVGTTAQINAALAPGLTYTPSLNFNGADTLTMVTNDLGATGSGGPMKDTDTVGITVVAVNDAPVNTVPGPQTTNEDTPLVITGLSVSDVDSGSSPINTLFEVNQGVLSINTSMPGTIVLPGGTVQLGNGAVVLGNGTNALQVVGTTSQINAALAPGLTYTPSLNFNGADTLTMVTNDLGATGSGGPMKDTDTVGITVVAVNDAPVNTVPGPQTTNEDTPLVITGLSVSDVDSGSSPINTLFEVNQGVLSINTSMSGTIILPGGTVQLGNGAVVLGNGTNALQVVGTTSQINAALAPGLTYTPSLNFNGADTLTMVTNDLGATGSGGPMKDTDTVGITVVAVNDAPVNTVPGPQTTNEDTPLVITGLAISDVDSGPSPLTTLFQVTQGVLTIDATMPGTVVLPDGTIQMGNGAIVLGNGTNALQILGTVAQTNAVLAPGLTYTPTFAYYGPDTLTMVTNDLGATGLGGPMKDTDTVAITVAPVVHPPILTVNTPNVSGFNGLPIPISITGALTDSNKPEVLTFDLSNVPTNAVLQDGLGVDHTGQSSYTFTLDQITGLSITMPDSRINTPPFTFSVIAIATDAALGQSASSLPGKVTVSVSSLNPYPVLSNLSATNVDQGSATTLTGTITSNRTSSFEVTVNWGDGSAPQTFAVNQQGQFAFTHVYLYEDANPSPSELTPIHVTVVDNFGLSTTGDTSLLVSNVAPTVSSLSITPGSLQIANTSTLTGTIFDPGPADTFTLTVNWGDGTAQEVIALPAGSTSFTLAHAFTDNTRGQPDQVNPVSVSVVDDHNGLGSALTSITVHDVNPTLINYKNTNVGSDGIVTIVGNATHPGTSPLTLTINWGDTVQVIQNVPQGNFTLTHFYSAPPDPANPSAPIAIHVSVNDDTQLSAAATGTAAVPGLGPLGGALALFYVQQQTTIPTIISEVQHVDNGTMQPIVLSFTTVQFDPRAPQGVTTAATKAVVALRIVDVEAGTEQGVVLLPVDILNNLPDLFGKLPDDHYRLYYVEQGTERLIMDVVVRQGKPVDPTDQSEGTLDRPPTSQMNRHPELPAANREGDGHAQDEPAAFDASVEPAMPGDVSLISPLGLPAASRSVDASPNISVPNEDVIVAVNRPSHAKYRRLLAPALAAVAATSVWSGDRWARQVDKELAQAPAEALTKAARLRRRLRRSDQGLVEDPPRPR